MKVHVYTVWGVHPIYAALSHILGVDTVADRETEISTFSVKNRFNRKQWSEFVSSVFLAGKRAGLKITKITYDGTREIPEPSTNLRLRGGKGEVHTITDNPDNPDPGMR